MKKIFLIATLALSFSALADIDEAGDAGTMASETEIATYRSCFQEFSAQGCRHPAEDREHFVSCMKETRSLVSSACSKMMTTLYGK